MTNEKYFCNCDPNNLPEWCPARQARHYRMLEFLNQLACVSKYSDDDIKAKLAAGYHYDDTWAARNLLKEIGEWHESDNRI